VCVRSIDCDQTGCELKTFFFKTKQVLIFDWELSQCPGGTLQNLLWRHGSLVQSTEILVLYPKIINHLIKTYQ